jgi:hypothetical protein
MATFGDIAHAIQDFSKTVHDDSTLTIEHIMFLMSKYRNYILLTANRNLLQTDYQTICINLDAGHDSTICGGRQYMKSAEQVPTTLEKGATTIAPPAGFMHSFRFQFVNYQKFQFVGYNKFLRSLVYVTIGPDGYMYMTGSGNAYTYLDKIRLTAVFDDIEKAATMLCDDNCKGIDGDVENKEFPMDGALVPLLIKYVTDEIYGS